MGESGGGGGDRKGELFRAVLYVVGGFGGGWAALGLNVGLWMGCVGLECGILKIKVGIIRSDPITSDWSRERQAT